MVAMKQLVTVRKPPWAGSPRAFAHRQTMVFVGCGHHTVTASWGS